MKNGTKVRLIKDASGDLPVRYIGRTGVVVKRLRPGDGIPMVSVKFSDRKMPLPLYIDEIVPV